MKLMSLKIIILNNMKKVFLFSIFSLLLLSVFLSVPVQAGYYDDLETQLSATAGAEGATFQAAADPRSIVAKVISVGAGFMGIIFTGMVFYAGFLWLSSGGNEEKVGKAKKIIIYSTIGAVLCLSAWSISYFVMSAWDVATTTVPINGETLDWNPAMVGSEFYVEPGLQTINN